MNLIRYEGEGKDKRRIEVPCYQVGPDPLGNIWAAPADFFVDGIYTGHLPEVAPMRAQKELDPFEDEA